MSNIINDEAVICSIKCTKEIKPSDTILNIFTNLFSFGVGGRITNDFKLTLTEENIYIEANSYATWGGLPETLYTDKISRGDIKSFEVTEEEDNEIIVLTTKNDKATIFIRDNEAKNYIGKQMAVLIAQTDK